MDAPSAKKDKPEARSSSDASASSAAAASRGESRASVSAAPREGLASLAFERVCPRENEASTGSLAFEPLGGSATTSANPAAAFAEAHAAYANPIHAKHAESVFASVAANATAAASASARHTLSAVAACTCPYPPRHPLAAFAKHCAGAAALRTKKYGRACMATSGVALNSENRGSRSARSVAAATPPHTSAARNAILT